MADDLGAVRRTPRPTPHPRSTGDRQAPETVAQPGREATQIRSEGKDADPPLSTRERLAELIAATDRHMTPEDFAEPRLAARAHATAILAAGWRAPRPDHDAALAELGRKLAEEPDSILFAGPQCDMEAYAALPPCTACEGGGQDTHGTPFEAPLAVHFAGPPVTIAGTLRQLCMWCGHVLLDVRLVTRAGDEPTAWPSGEMIRIEDGIGSVVPYVRCDTLPPGCCAARGDGPDEAQETRAAADWPAEETS